VIEVMNSPISETTVTIRGVAYQLRGDADPQHIGRLAAYVDDKMRVLEEAARTQSPARLAILASLTIADEFFQERKVREADGERVQARAARLHALLDEALKEG
jgi:cell division protein ZapA